LYSLFFLWIEPFATLVGAFFAWFLPTTYLTLTDAASVPQEQVVLGLPPVATLVSLRQLGNLYFAFALIEAFVLRAASAPTDLNVWRTLLICLLIADFGHLLSCAPLGLDSYYDVAGWNAIAYGNYLFVYFGASFRISFLLGLGFPRGLKKKGKQRSGKKSDYCYDYCYYFYRPKYPSEKEQSGLQLLKECQAGSIS
ncbi:hypothetical protein DV735_g2381, partial [Chaetothyriales sp. CBS 134920]